MDDDPSTKPGNEDQPANDLNARFPGFKDLEDAELDAVWADAIIVLDANILLGALRDVKLFESLRLVLKPLRERVWSPHQFALEYTRLRDGQSRRLRDIIEGTPTAFQQALRKFEDDLNKDVRPAIDVKDFVERLRSACQNLLQQSEAAIAAKMAEVVEHCNAVHAYWNEIFGNNIGAAPSEDTLWEIHRRGERRFASGIPPGFRDGQKGNDLHRYGDLVAWCQVLDKSAETARPIIFVTDDAKTDWWDDFKGGKAKAPLAQEVYERSGQGYCQYSSVAFVREALQRFNLPALADVIGTGATRQASSTIEAAARIVANERSEVEWPFSDDLTLGEDLDEEYTRPEIQRLSFGYVASLLGNHFGSSIEPKVAPRSPRVFDSEDDERLTRYVKRIRGLEDVCGLTASDGLLLSDAVPLTYQTFGPAANAIHITNRGKVTARFKERGAHQYYDLFMSLAVPFYIVRFMSKAYGVSPECNVHFAFLNEKPNYPDILPKPHYDDYLSVDVAKQSFADAYAESVMKCLRDSGVGTTRVDVASSLDKFWQEHIPD
jgi:hypothetical protein